MAQFPLKFMINGTILILIFQFLDGVVLRRTLYGVYISQLMRFAKASSNVSHFSCRNKALTAKLLNVYLFAIMHCLFLCTFMLLVQYSRYFTDCGDDLTVANGQVRFLAGTKYNNAAFISCKEGFVINGTETFKCLSNGKWSIDAKCVPKGKPLK